MITIPLWGTIIYVPSQYPTIQQGLNAAQYGDTVLVAAETYLENITWYRTSPQFPELFLYTKYHHYWIYH
jgi:hypothetical protein